MKILNGPFITSILKYYTKEMNMKLLGKIFVCASLFVWPVFVFASGEFTESPDRYNVVWDSPSKDQNGSVPLGNGSTGLNAWIEPNGDLVFYISRTDSWGDNGRLLKLGRVRISLDPAPATDDFLQTLSLEDGTLKARIGDTQIKLWVDANHPVIHAEFEGSSETVATASFEMWRTEQASIPSSWECSDVNLFRPREGQPWNIKNTVMEPDTLLNNQKGRIGWYHRNIKSVGPAMHAKIQGMADFQREDPLLHRTFGAVICAEEGEVLDETHLRSANSKAHRFDVYVHTKHPATEQEWLNELQGIIEKVDAGDLEVQRAEHAAWWKAFWQRSWIHATEGSGGVEKKTLIPSNSLNFRFGVNPSGGNKFTGQMGRATLLKRALNESEIKALADSQSETSELKQEDILFTSKPILYSELENSSEWTDFQELTMEVWIKPDGANARVLDKTQPGSNEGFLLDTHPGNGLRLIMGDETFSVPDCLKAGQWNHIAVVVDSHKEKTSLYLNGKQIAGKGSDNPLKGSYIVSRGYALQRYVTACAGRGAYPIKFNGSIFTVEGFEKGKSRGPDYRKWGPGYWWQNTRLPYISMCTSGDFEMTDPLYKMYCKDLLEYHKHRTQRHTGHNGIYVPECIYFWGEMFAETYGRTPFEEREDKLQDNRYHKWEWVSGPELTFMMLDRYEHTLDEAFLRDTILPFANEITTFFIEHYKTDANGKLVMHPSQALETWWECTNPMPETAGLHAITDRMLSLPERLTTPGQRAFWQKAKRMFPDLPTREVNGVKMYAPAEKFAMCKNSEVPELYAVFPFRQSSFEQENVQLGIEALNHRGPKGYQGWRQDSIFMAYLGLAEQAQKDLIGRAKTKHVGSRFPAFWGPNMDWIPDQDHGGVLMKTFQSMILQSEGEKIFLLPAWPKDWNAEFKLHAPYKTIVEGRVENGNLIDLKVTPESRRKDIVNVTNKNFLKNK